MINFKFVKAQLKNIRLLLIISFIIIFVLLIPALTQKYFTSSASLIGVPDDNGSINWITDRYFLGAVPILSTTYFGPAGLAFMYIIGFNLSRTLISKEINQGYMASWLTIPMSRKNILNSKIFILISSMFSFYLFGLIIQIIAFPAMFPDFQAKFIINLLLANLSFIILALLWASINYFIIVTFNKTSIIFILAIGISVLFIIFKTLPLFSLLPGMAWLENFKYFTIISLFNFPFQQVPISFNRDNGQWIGIIKNGNIHSIINPIKALDFVWQIPTMLVATSGLFYLGNYFFIKKDLNL